MASLAKEIIYGTDDDVARALARTGEIDVIDEYGYTPLIQTTIVDSIHKAALLLEAGAKVDFPDLTNRTALHWAASNGNRDLSNLLLNHGANPNTYTHAGQPVLVTPLLNKQKALCDLLIRYGADLNFARDFINAKLIGHRFELEGRVDIVDTANTFIEVELEGFYLNFNLEAVTNSLADFRANFGSKHLRKFFKKIDITLSVLYNAIELLKYQHYLVDVEQHRKKIAKLLDATPLVLPIAFTGHAITLIKYWDWLIRCDRGEFGRKHGTVILYHMQKPTMLTKAFMMDLLYKRQYAEGINTALQDYLGLEQIWTLPLSTQRAGNCSWANVEAVIPALLFLLFLEDENGRRVVECQHNALALYDEWIEWDKNRALQFCLQTAEETTNRARQAAKAALMAAVMFQACDYNNAKDRYKVRRMLPLLSLPEFSYILQSYFEVFGKEHKNPRLKNLYNFLDDFGVLREFVHLD